MSGAICHLNRAGRSAVVKAATTAAAATAASAAAPQHGRTPSAAATTTATAAFSTSAVRTSPATLCVGEGAAGNLGTTKDGDSNAPVKRCSGDGGLSVSSLGAKRAMSSKASLLAPAAAASSGARGVHGGAPLPARVDAVVIGAGQAGLSVAYHLQKAGGLRFVTLDANQEPGGAWRHRWPSLELFSTRRWSSLPGYPMFANGACEDGYPSTREMAMYMEEYESVMKLNVVRPVTVTGVSRTTMGTFLVETDCLLGGTPARWEARTVVSASGTHASPMWPRLPGSENFRGAQLHSSQYRPSEDFRGARVAVVGAGNSGAQILAEVSKPLAGAASVLWSTQGEPSFLPVGLSGKEIFDTVARLRQRQGFVREEDIPSLNSIIMQPGVVEASTRGVYDAPVPAFTRLTPTGVAWEASADGSSPAGEADVDVIIWCTGYRSNTSHLSRLGVVRQDSTVAMDGRDMGESDMPGVFAVGYGNWAGVGSGSIPGSTVYAKRAATAAVQHLRGGNSYDSSKVAVEATMTGQFPSAQRASVRAWPTARRASGTPVSGVAAAVAGASGATSGGSRFGKASPVRVEDKQRVVALAA